MKPLAWIGLFLIVAGIVVVARRGIPYTKSRSEVEVGPLKVTSQRLQEQYRVDPGDLEELRTQRLDFFFHRRARVVARDDRAETALECLAAGLEIDLRLAASSNAVQ